MTVYVSCLAFNRAEMVRDAVENFERTVGKSAYLWPRVQPWLFSLGFPIPSAEKNHADLVDLACHRGWGIASIENRSVIENHRQAVEASCLELGTIERWVNHEVCDVPSVANDTRYHRILHEAFRWFRDRRVFPARTTVVAAHAIEHLHDADFMALIHGFAQADTLIFEAPIGEGPSDWTGYEGTHILRMGWRDIRGALREYGYKPERITDTVWRFHRGTT